MSAEHAEQIVKTEEYCITSLQANIEHALRCGIRASEQATNILAIASTVAASLEKGDMSKGLLISMVNSYAAIAKKHLIREYIVSGEDIIVRQYLIACPHTEPTTVQEQKTVVYH